MVFMEPVEAFAVPQVCTVPAHADLERKLRVAREALEYDAAIYGSKRAREALRQLDEVGAYTERDK